MCGICGIVEFGSGVKADSELLARMNRRMVHRGPDETGIHCEGNVGLASQRLSIIDLKGGHQPLSNEDQTVWVVYNGEIYNHKQLQRDLEARGHRYQSHSDTETIVHLYEEYGSDCPQHLRGMFAFAIWDRKKQKLFAARDRFGIKPFYYFHDGNRFVFASEIKALLAHPRLQTCLNQDGVAEYLAFGFLSGTSTLFDGIRKLPPGHTLEVNSQGDLTTRPYWQLKADASDDRLTQSEAVERYRVLLDDSVRSHLMSDVPLGMFLSGGLDSSVLAALMTKMRGEPVQTFSVGYAEDAYSELPPARVVSQHVKSMHHAVLVGADEFQAALPSVIWHEDEPPAWPSTVALFFVSQLAKEHVKVVLTGEGSDETLGGYARYVWTLWNVRANRIYKGMVPSRIREIGRKAISGMTGDYRRQLEHTFLGRDGGSWRSLYFDNFLTAFSGEELQRLLDTDHARIDGGHAEAMSFWQETSGDLLRRMLVTDIRTYLVELLQKQDRMSMAASVESRVPYLDHPLVEFAIGLPSEFLIRGFTGKRILKEIAKGLLPPEIVQRRKAGFPTPWAQWLKQRWIDEIKCTLTEPRAMERRLFRKEEVQKLFDEHQSGKRDNAHRIWRLLMLELWHRVFIDRDLTPEMPVDAQARAFR